MAQQNIINLIVTILVIFGTVYLVSRAWRAGQA